MNIKSLLTLSLVTALGLSGTGAAMASPSNGVLVRQDGIYLRCDQCGTVQSVQHNVTQGRNSGTAGAIIGAVAGGVLGNQIGKGSYANVQVKDASSIRQGDLVQVDPNGNITRIQ